jgi:hypothetical protein
VTTQRLSADQLRQLSDEVGPERTFWVLCSAFRGKVDDLSNLTVKKIPKQVLSRCEWLSEYIGQSYFDCLAGLDALAINVSGGETSKEGR